MACLVLRPRVSTFPMLPMDTNQRKSERSLAQVRFDARDAGGAGTLTFLSGDVSAGGAFLKSDLLLEQGEVLSLRFEVSGDCVLQAQARVAWVRRFPQPGQSAGMGVEFFVIRDEDRTAISQWLAH